METTRLIHKDLITDMKQITSNTDRLGFSGMTLYSCHNYTSPIHRDSNDAVRGICCQLLLDAQVDWKEYSFIYAEYGFFIETATNCLW